MRHRITILKPVCKEDEFGGTSMNYEEAGNCWAEFLRPSFHNQSFEGDGDAEIITQGIRIRPREVKRGFFVREGTREFEVLHVDNSTPGEFILTTQEVDHHGT